MREVLYNILIEFGILIKLVRLIKVCLTETCSRVRVGKNFSHMFLIRNGLKQGDYFIFFNFALEYAIRRVQVNQGGLKLIGSHQFLVYADVNILGGNLHTAKRNTESLVVTSKEIGLEVNADKTKYMIVPRDQHAGRSHNIKTDNSSFERAEDIKYLGTTLTYRNSIQEEIKSRLE